MQVKGYNPLRWDCESRGCFNKLKRPKIEEFADCFPGRINFGDVDGLVEINGSGLFLEWKEAPMSFSTGQRLLMVNLSRGGALTWICVAGDAETMEISHMAFCHNGTLSPWKESSIEGVKIAIKRWVKYTKVRKELHDDAT